VAATFETLGAVTATSAGTAVIGGSNAKGSWVALGTSTIAAKSIYLFTYFQDAGAFVFDIGSGSPGSETVIVPDLLLDQAGTAGSALNGFMFGPIYCDIASSSALSVRAETTSVAAGSETCPVTILLCDSIALPELTSYTYASYGFALGADAKGSAVDPGAVAHTKGAYTEITASAQSSIEHIHFHIGNQANGTATSAVWLIDIAIGSEGSETDILSNIFVGGSTSSDMVTPAEIIVRGDQFAGQRISARAQCSITDATDRIVTVGCLTIAGAVVTGGSGGAAQLVNSGALVG
jgi:hypothetical protein